VARRSARVRQKLNRLGFWGGHYYRLRILLFPAIRLFREVRDFLIAAPLRLFIKGLRRVNPNTSSDFMGRLARFWGPWLPTSRLGRTNLKIAFPEKSDAEREEILKGAWENLGRVAGEFVHLETFWDYDDASPNTGRMETYNTERFIGLYTDNKPGLIFSAHLGNWELAAIGARKYGLDSAMLFRMPSNRFLGDVIKDIRAETMSQLIPAGTSAGLFMGAVLDRGGHLGILVDQHRKPGSRVKFFGRECWANNTIARLARQYDCPVHGVRVVRLPHNRFRIAITRAMELPRDSEGLIDIDGTMQAITTVVENWVREHPEQWLWFARRWRD
jgi:KDO2-lipid IV(A) lauroyltransferase